MALGNANTSAQSRGKNKPVIVKRRKEVVLAKSYNSFQISEALTGVSNQGEICASSASVNTTVYHNGSSATPGKNDLIYTRARKNDKYLLEDGYYRAVINNQTGKPHFLIVGNGAAGQGIVAPCK